MFCGLNIAMNDSLLVSGLEGFRHFDQQADDRFLVPAGFAYSKWRDQSRRSISLQHVDCEL